LATDQLQDRDDVPTYSPWNPGLKSELSGELLPLVTLFRCENSHIDYSQAKELSEFCGLKPTELVFLKTQRLILHELLIRVTADLYIPDGPNYEDFGINLRAMVDVIFKKHLSSQLDVIETAHKQVEQSARERITQIMAAAFQVNKPATAPKPSFIAKWFGKTQPSIVEQDTTSADHCLKSIDAWNDQIALSDDRLEIACLRAVTKIIGKFVGKRGSLIGDQDMLGELAVRLVSNTYGSQAVGETLEPMFVKAAIAEGFRILPAQQKPVIMNVKGASAAGKSTIRSKQQQLAEKLGIPWEDFAVISPDYWRKHLLDYGALGDHYKYAAMLTGQELEIIDQKLDMYMAEKAAAKSMSHLLIDRFRFDSFSTELERGEDSKLLTRFGDLVFLFFMITPPAATVERAWFRGLKTGRYKAVDDLLFHNVEAYTGMPELFFSWALAKDKRVHFEFLDNDVPLGERPRTAAFGWNGTMTILDVEIMLNIDRYKNVNIDARAPDEVLSEADLIAKKNTGFLSRCIKLFPVVNFADRRTGQIYGRAEDGEWTWCDKAYAEKNFNGEDANSVFQALGWNDTREAMLVKPEPNNFEEDKAYTLGEW